MSKVTKPRGFNDLDPSEFEHKSKLLNEIKTIFNSYFFKEIETPIVEKKELFIRSVGEETDIVNKEMFTFQDRKGEGLVLRPEGTAGCLRFAIDSGLLDLGPIKLSYAGPMFRYERPQKGRSRQFFQVSAETYGVRGFEADLELLMMANEIFQRFGMSNVSLNINSLGDEESQKKYASDLKKYLSDFSEALDEDSLKRLETNPLRILDSKNEETQKVIKNAPKISSFLSQKSADNYELIKEGLNDLGISYIEDEKLVRGLDYYNDLVFEWTSPDLGSQNTFCGGGRYDRLSKQLGGRDCPAAGFSIGLDRLALITQANKSTSSSSLQIILTDESYVSDGLQLSQKLRKDNKDLRVLFSGYQSSLKNQLKKADKNNIDFAVIIGPEEVRSKNFSLKKLKEDEDQLTLEYDQLVKELKNE